MVRRLVVLAGTLACSVGAFCFLPASSFAWTINPMRGVPDTSTWQYSKADEFNKSNYFRTVGGWVQLKDLCAKNHYTCGSGSPHTWDVYAKVYYSGLHDTCIYINTVQMYDYTWGSFYVALGPMNVEDDTSTQTVDYGGDENFPPETPSSSGWAYAGYETYRLNRWYCSVKGTNQEVELQDYQMGNVEYFSGASWSNADHTDISIVGP